MQNHLSPGQGLARSAQRSSGAGWGRQAGAGGMTPRTPRSSLAVQGYTPLGGSQDPPPLPLAAAGLQHGGTPPDTPPSADGAPASPRADAPAPAHAADRGATTPRTPAAGGAPPRAGSRGERGGAAPATPRTPRTPRTPGDTPGLLDNVSNKGGWIQTSVTVSDLTVAGWTQQKQDMFIEAVAATAQVGLSDVCVLSLKEKCGRRLLSIATEITFQVKASSREHAQEVVRDLKSSSLDSMMLQANIRIRPDTARAPDESGGSTPRDKNPFFGTPFRNGYSLSSSYMSQFGADAPHALAADKVADGADKPADGAEQLSAGQGGLDEQGHATFVGTMLL